MRSVNALSRASTRSRNAAAVPGLGAHEDLADASRAGSADRELAVGIGLRGGINDRRSVHLEEFLRHADGHEHPVLVYLVDAGLDLVGNGENAVPLGSHAPALANGHHRQHDLHPRQEPPVAVSVTAVPLSRVHDRDMHSQHDRGLALSIQQRLALAKQRIVQRQARIVLLHESAFLLGPGLPVQVVGVVSHARETGGVDPPHLHRDRLLARALRVGHAQQSQRVHQWRAGINFRERRELRHELVRVGYPSDGRADDDIAKERPPGVAEHVQETRHHAHDDHHQRDAERDGPDGDERDQPRSEVAAGQEKRKHEGIDPTRPSPPAACAPTRPWWVAGFHRGVWEWGRSHQSTERHQVRRSQPLEPPS